MKKTLFYGSIKTTFLILFAVILLAGCKKDEMEEPASLIKKATITLSGANEVPAVSTPGTGTAEIAYDPTMKMITYKITWQFGSLAATTTNMHFHGSDTGSDMVNSPPVIPLTGFATSSGGTLSGMTVALTSAQEAQLLAGKWYLNLHSSTFPGGELRGNIKL